MPDSLLQGIALAVAVLPEEGIQCFGASPPGWHQPCPKFIIDPACSILFEAAANVMDGHRAQPASRHLADAIWLAVVACWLRVPGSPWGSRGKWVALP